MMKYFEKNGYSVDIRLRIRNGEEPVFGSGVCALLAKTESHQSLKAAADEMGMNYKKALRIIRRAEAFYGKRLLLRSIGGAGGGGSRLTPFAAGLVEQFGILETELINCIEKMHLLSPLVFPEGG